jgi:hypothetical protein
MTGHNERFGLKTLALAKGVNFMPKRLHAQTATELDALMPSILDKGFGGNCKSNRVCLEGARFADILLSRFVQPLAEEF